MYTVYLHINKLNGKKYFGQTAQTTKLRWGKGSTYKGSNKFYNAINKYGWDNFNHFEILNNLTKEEADELETKLITYYDTIQCGYNICIGGSGVMVGRTHSQQAKDKIRKARCKQEFTKESQKLKACTMLGFKYDKIIVTFKDGNERRYDLVSEIANDLNMSQPHINKCLNGVRKSHLGCTFHYVR